MRNQRHLWALAAALLAACGDYGAPDEVLYGEAVITQPKIGYDFGPLGGSYYLDETFRLVDGETITETPLPSNVIATIETNMSRLGYARVDTNNPNADLAASEVGVKVTILKGNVDVYYPGYWCDYWYYYSCWYGGYYYGGSYDVGTVILEMGDLSGFTFPPPDPPQTLDILWTALIYGVATTNVYDTPRIIDGINRAFGQSPYLATN